MSATGAEPASGAQGATVWLCRPGTTPDPCVSDLGATAVGPNGSVTRQAAPPPSARAASFDCFYVYPTVVGGPGDNAPLQVEASITAAARSQVSRFSQVCRVWAPIYRQRTEASLGKGLGADPAADAVA